MKNLLAILGILISYSALADKKVSGAAAEKLFIDLAGNYEYSSGVKATAISIETITRHDNNGILCSQDTIKYNTGAVEVSYECVIRPY